MKMGSGGQRGSSSSPNLPVDTDPPRKRGVPCTASRKRHGFTTRQEGRFSPGPAAAQPMTDCHSSAVKSRHTQNSQLPPWTLYSQQPLLIPLLLYKQVFLRISLGVRWSRLCTSSARSVGSIPGQGTELPHVEPHDQKTE